MTRNPRMEKLKDRLTPAQWTKRQEEITAKALWRKNVESGITDSFKNSTAVGQYAVKNIRTQRKINWGFAAAVVALAVKIFFF